MTHQTKLFREATMTRQSLQKIVAEIEENQQKIAAILTEIVAAGQHPDDVYMQLRIASKQSVILQERLRYTVTLMQLLEADDGMTALVMGDYWDVFEQHKKGVKQHDNYVYTTRISSVDTDEA